MSNTACYILVHINELEKTRYGFIGAHCIPSAKIDTSINKHTVTTKGFMLRTEWNGLTKTTSLKDMEKLLVKAVNYYEGTALTILEDPSHAGVLAILKNIGDDIDNVVIQVYPNDTASMYNKMVGTSPKHYDSVVLKYIGEEMVRLHKKKTKLTFVGIKDEPIVKEAMLIAKLDCDPAYPMLTKYDNPRDYVSTPNNLNPLFSFKNIYYNNDNNDNGVYYTASPDKKDITVGTKTAQVGYGVIKIDNDPVLTTVQKKFSPVITEKDTVVVLRGDVIFSPRIHKALLRYGDEAVINHGDIPVPKCTFPADDTELGICVIPKGLISIGAEHFAALESVLMGYLEKDKTEYVYADITTVFYEKNAKDILVIKKEHGVGTKFVKVKLDVAGRKRVFTLVLGKSLPTRNHMAKLAKSEIKVTLAYVESTRRIRFNCIVETNNGVGIYSTIHGDVIHL